MLLRIQCIVNAVVASVGHLAVLFAVIVHCDGYTVLYLLLLFDFVFMQLFDLYYDTASNFTVETCHSCFYCSFVCNKYSVMLIGCFIVWLQLNYSKTINFFQHKEIILNVRAKRYLHIANCILSKFPFTIWINCRQVFKQYTQTHILANTHTHIRIQKPTKWQAYDTNILKSYMYTNAKKLRGVLEKVGSKIVYILLGS